MFLANYLIFPVVFCLLSVEVSPQQPASNTQAVATVQNVPSNMFNGFLAPTSALGRMQPFGNPFFNPEAFEDSFPPMQFLSASPVSRLLLGNTALSQPPQVQMIQNGAAQQPANTQNVVPISNSLSAPSAFGLMQTPFGGQNALPQMTNFPNMPNASPFGWRGFGGGEDGEGFFGGGGFPGAFPGSANGLGRMLGMGFNPRQLVNQLPPGLVSPVSSVAPTQNVFNNFTGAFPPWGRMPFGEDSMMPPGLFQMQHMFQPPTVPTLTSNMSQLVPQLQGVGAPPYNPNVGMFNPMATMMAQQMFASPMTRNNFPMGFPGTAGFPGTLLRTAASSPNATQASVSALMQAQPPGLQFLGNNANVPPSLLFANPSYMFPGMLMPQLLQQNIMPPANSPLGNPNSGTGPQTLTVPQKALPVSPVKQPNAPMAKSSAPPTQSVKSPSKSSRPVPRKQIPRSFTENGRRPKKGRMQRSKLGSKPLGSRKPTEVTLVQPVQNLENWLKG